MMRIIRKILTTVFGGAHYWMPPPPPPQKCAMTNVEIFKNGELNHSGLGFNSVLLGTYITCNHNHCVLIGEGIKSEHDYQLVIGNSRVNLSRKMTKKEYREIREALKRVEGTLSIWRS